MLKVIKKEDTLYAKQNEKGGARPDVLSPWKDWQNCGMKKKSTREEAENKTTAVDEAAK